MTTNFESQPHEPAPPDAPMFPPHRDEPVATVSRVTFNYLLISALFLAIGIAIGFVAYDRIAQSARAAVDTDALITSAVSTAVASLPTPVSVEDAAAAAANARQTVRIEGSPSEGAADAEIVIVEFGDFRCGYCKRFFDETLTPLMEQYDGRILHVYRNFPLLGPDSLSAALAAQCAHDQELFWPFHELLYATPENLTRDAFLQYAAMLQMDVPTFTTCFDEEQHRSAVIQDYVDGQNLGVGGTPTFFINGKILIGAQPIDQFVLQIEAELLTIEADREAAQATPASS